MKKIKIHIFHENKGELILEVNLFFHFSVTNTFLPFFIILNQAQLNLFHKLH